MTGFTKAAVTATVVSTGVLGSGFAFAHGAHEPAEGVMHLVAHFIESMDQSWMLAGVVGIVAVVVMARRFRNNHRD